MGLLVVWVLATMAQVPSRTAAASDGLMEFAKSDHRGASIVSVKSSPAACMSYHAAETNSCEQAEDTMYNIAPCMAVLAQLTAGHGGIGRSGGSHEDELATAAKERDNRTSAPPPQDKPALMPIAVEQNAARSSWTEEYRRYVARVMGDPLGAGEMAAILAPIAAYWITSSIHALLAGWCAEYRLHSKFEENKNLVPKAVVFRTVLLLQIMQAAVSFVFFKVNPRGAQTSTSSTPTFVLLPWQFLVAMLVLDTWQYLGHRLMHQNRFLYRHFHSFHHRVVAPYAFAAQYNHPVEALLLDTVSGGLAVFVSGMSPLTSAYFLSFATIKGVDDHAGTMIPYNPLHLIFGNNTAYHDVHHQLRGNKGNFSQPFFRTWDLAMGTHVAYRIVRAAHGGLEAVPNNK